MRKVLMIGIDGLDSVLLSRFETELPHLSKLKQESPNIAYKSVFPPDTPTAWASIYTGLNPAKHGTVYFVDPLERVSILSYKDVDNSFIKGRTFWDIASRFGKRVCILLPELGYPVWSVNGIMVGRSHQLEGNNSPLQSFPTSLSQEHNLLLLSYLKWMPKKKLILSFLEAQKTLIHDEFDFSLKMLAKEDWDLFFIYSPVLDWLGHNMWSYFDETDPSYPGPNPYQDICQEFYQLYDEVVGHFIEAADSDTSIIVFSDHGFGMRPQRLLNINEILRRDGLLIPNIKRKSISDPYYAFELLKRKATDFVNKHGAGSIIMKVLRYFPSAKRVFTAPISIDWNKTCAYVSDLSGIKSYYYGGIIIERKNLKNRDYEEVRSMLIEEIKGIKEPETDDNLVRWICRREELYSGEYIYKYPDIVFQLREDYGAGWATFEPILGQCRTHNIQPGSHRIDTPLFLISNVGNTQLIKRNMELMDVAPTVLHLLDIEGDFGFDGETILKKG